MQEFPKCLYKDGVLSSDYVIANNEAEQSAHAEAGYKSFLENAKITLLPEMGDGLVGTTNAVKTAKLK